MDFKYSGEANLGAKPERRFVAVGDEQRPVVDLRLYFSRLVPNPSKEAGAPKWIDSGGFWMTATVWGRMADQCYELLTKGSRVHVEGIMYLDKPYKNKEGVETQSHRLTVDRIFPAMGRIASIGYKAKDTKVPGAKPSKADEEEFFDGPDDSNIPDHAF